MTTGHVFSVESEFLEARFCQSINFYSSVTTSAFIVPNLQKPPPFRLAALLFQLPVCPSTAGWVVQSRDEVNLTAGRGIAIREFPMKPGFGEADYLLDGQALGIVEAKKEGSTLTGFEGQTAKYSEGLPDSLPAPKRPLPFG